jgi:hypothetical protein
MNYQTMLEAHPNSLFRIRFSDGQTFVLRVVRDASEAAGRPDTWTGFIVAREGLSDRDMKLHPVGGGLDFRLADIVSLSVIDL